VIESRNTQELLALRRLTVALSTLLTQQVRAYLSTLAPLLRPRAVLGEYVEGGAKEAARGADAAFKDLQENYAAVAAAPPFNLSGELTPPVEIISTALELTVFEYSYTARAGGAEKSVVVTSPLRWILSYSGFGIGRLRELVATRDRSAVELREFLLHHLILHTVLTRQEGVTGILDTLHFPVKSETIDGLGKLPVTSITSAVSTGLPADEVIIESTEISGRNVFEEIVNVDDVVKLRDPLRERLIELIKSHDEGLLKTT
jgi:hypothetical protein